MSEPTTAITFGVGIVAGVLLREWIVRIPPTVVYLRRLHEAARRESEVEHLRQRIDR